MYREPLEIYLLDKIRSYSPLAVERVEVRLLEEPELGCNWDLHIIEPSLPLDTIHEIDRAVIAPLKAEFNLVD
jgi:hypothetical protein